MRHFIFGALLCITSMIYETCNAQVSGNINLSNRRISPPRVLPSSRQTQQQPQQQRRPQTMQRQRPPFNRFSPSPGYFNTAYLTDRVNRLEDEIRHFARAMNGITNTIRMTVNTMLGDRLARVQEEIQSQKVRIDDNQGKVDQASQELEYIKNSNANMQKRMDRIEATQREQGETIESIQRLLTSMRNVERDENTSNKTVSHQPARSDNHVFDRLSSSVVVLTQRMNSSDAMLTEYNDRVQSFANNILVLSEKTNSLQRDSLSTARWLNSIRGEVTKIEQQVRKLQVKSNSSRSSPTYSDITIVNQLQSAVNDLNSSIMIVAENQRQQSLMLQNITSPTEDVFPSTSENKERSEVLEDVADNSETIFQLASTVINLEESFHQLEENYEIWTLEARMRLKELGEGVSANRLGVQNLRQKFQTVPVISSSVDELNATLQYLIEAPQAFSTIFANATTNPPKQLSETSNQIILQTTSSFFPIKNLSFSQPNIVTFDILENRLQSLINNLTTDKNSSKDFKVSAGNKVTESQTANSDFLSNSPFFTQLQSNVDVLNTTVAVQGSMLQQAIGALGDYDRSGKEQGKISGRARGEEFEMENNSFTDAEVPLYLSGPKLQRNENQEKVKEDENLLIRELLENATHSLSRMSLSVAEHELILPSIYESLTTGDEILLDLNQQIYDHELSLDKLNKTLTSVLDRQRKNDVTNIQSNLNAYSQTVQRSDMIPREQVAAFSPEHFVNQEEFGALAVTVTDIIGKIKGLNRSQTELKSLLNATAFNMNSNFLSVQSSKNLTKLWVEINSIKNLVELLENVMESLSSSNLKSNRQIAALRQSLELLQSNTTTNTRAGLHSEEFIRLLDTSVRELRVEVNEQSNWLSNQRRRIRQLEDEQLHSLVTINDLSSLNKTVEMEIKRLEEIIKTLKSEMLFTVAQRSKIGRNNSNYQSLSSSKDEASLEIVENKLNQIMTLLTGSSFENNTTYNRLLLFEELKTVPLTLRILEGQVQDFQDSIQSLAQLEIKVSALNSLRNLVFQNSGDITTFHQSVSDLEVEIADVKRKSTVIEFSNQRLRSYQDDLRLKLNQTKLTLDRTNGENAIQAQQIRILSRFLDGNATELKGRIDENKFNLAEKSQQLDIVSNKVNDLERDLRQQESADLIRHTELNSRLNRDEKRIESLEKICEDNQEMLSNATRAISEETNARVSALESNNNGVESLRQMFSTVERQSSENRQSLNQNNRQLNTIQEKQAQHYNEISDLKILQRATTKELQEIALELQSTNEEQDGIMGNMNSISQDLNDLRDSFNIQSTTLMSIRQKLVVINDDVNSLQQTTQRNSIFANRAEQALDRHNSDISFILEHSSNHSVAIQKLKHLINDSPRDTNNVTHGLLTELSLMDHNIRGLNEELITVKRNIGIREAAALRLEEQCRENANEAKSSKKNIRDNSEVLHRLQGDIRRYSERIRTLENNAQDHTIARNDLQQVVLSNREELSLLSSIPNDLNRIRQEFATFVTRQDNRSQTLEHSLKDAKLRLTSITGQVSDHDNTFQTLRQDRISLAANIDQILQSSSNLEQLLRATVTDLAQLRRDFDSQSDIRNAVPRLQRLISSAQENNQRLEQTVTSNENKISRIQDLVDSTTGTVNTIMMATQSRLSQEQSREQSRSNDVRGLRESVGRSSVLLRTLQNELHSHNERIHLLNRHVIELDKRVSKPSVLENDIEDPIQTDLAASGWLFPSTEVLSRNEFSEVNHNLNSNSNKYTQLLQRVNNLSESFVNFTEILKDDFANLVDRIDQKLNESSYEESLANYEVENLIEVLPLLNKSQEKKVAEDLKNREISEWSSSLFPHLQQKPAKSENQDEKNKNTTFSPFHALSRLLLTLSEQFKSIDVTSLLDYTLTYETEEDSDFLSEENEYSENPLQSSHGLFHNVSESIRKISKTLEKFNDLGKKDFLRYFEDSYFTNTTTLENRLTMLEELLVANIANPAINKNLPTTGTTQSINVTDNGESIHNLTIAEILQSDVLSNKITHFLANWKEMKDVQKNLSILRNVFSHSNFSLQLQQQNIASLQRMQVAQSGRLNVLKNNSRSIETELKNLKNKLQKELTDVEQKLKAENENSKQEFLLKQLGSSNRISNLQLELNKMNSSLILYTDKLSQFQTDFGSRFNQNISSFQNTLDLHSETIKTVQDNNHQIKQRLETVEGYQKSSRDRFQMIDDDLINLNYDIEWSNNRTDTLVSQEKLHDEKERLQIIQNITSISNKVAAARENFSSLSRKQDELILLLRHFNRSATNQSSASDLVEVVNKLRGKQNNQDLSLSSHSVQLRGLSQRIQTFEDMIGTMSDSLVLHGDKLLLLSEKVFSSKKNNWKETTNNISQILTNHSALFRNIKNQLSMLLTKINQQSSVRVVVSDANQHGDSVAELNATQASTSTANVYVPPPTSVFATSINGNQLNVSWLSPLGARIDNYRLTIENVADSLDTFQITAVRSPVIVNNVSPSRRYSISVQSVYNQDSSLPATVFIETTFPPTTVSMTELSTIAQPSLFHNTTLDPNSIYTNLLAQSIEDIPSQNIVYKCDFDNLTLCGFLDDDTDDFNWTHWNGSTPSSDTGPLTDHTQKVDGGFYMYIEASRPRKSGNVARLFSPLLQATDGQCLRFYYHMYGVGTGDLSVLLVSNDRSSSSRIWFETGNNGNQWKNAKVTITSDFSFRLAFEAVTGIDYHSDIAIDDVTIQDGVCPEPLLQCSFETTDICGFIQDYDDDFDWDRSKGATSSADTGPTADHTMGTASGYYLFLESSNPRIPNDTTRLSSPMLSATDGQCLQFYYHMHGVDIGTLNVYLRHQSNSRELGKPIWTKRGPQGNVWHLSKISITSLSSFQIVFEGVRGENYHGDIALDDVSVTDGACSQPACADGESFENFCYKIEKDKRTYQEAKDFCISKGGLLASIKSNSQQTFITKLLDKDSDSWRLFWLGLDDREEEGRFIHSDGTQLSGGFTAWDAGEPFDALGDEDCVNLEYGSNDRRWNDVSCDRRLGFICQHSVS